MFASGAGDWRGPVAEAIALLDETRPTLELMVALQELACVSLLGNGDCRGGGRLRRRRLSLAERLDGPLPVGALGWRGAARCWLGDDRGLDDYQEAIAVAAHGGSACNWSTSLYNYACCVSPRRGPAAALPLFCENQELARQRGSPMLSLDGRACAVVCHE